MQKSILVIEDDLILNQQISALLANHNYQVTSSNDGKSGLDNAINHHYDLIILDVRLPFLSGYKILEQLRVLKQTPVLILSACGAEQERIKGLSLGADDYLSKPFNFDELHLRIEAILRRTFSSAPNEHRDLITHFALKLNKRNFTAHFQEQELDITHIQFNLLWQLVENKGEPLSKAYLYQQVLKRQFSRYDRSLDMHLSRLRKKLISAGMNSETITTLHGRGYCFNG